MNYIKTSLLCLLLYLTLAASVKADTDAAVGQPAMVSFRADVAPILLDQCVSCHGARKAEGGYRLDSFEEAMIPGDSDQSPITAGDLEASEIVVRIKSPHDSERMPEGRPPMAEEAIATISNWVSQGATFDAQLPGQPLHLLVPPTNFPAAPESYPAPLAVTGLAVTPDGLQVVTSGYHEVLVWDLSTGSLVKRIGNMPQRVFAIEFSPVGNWLAVGGGTPGRSGEVRFLSWPNGELKGVLARSTDVVLDLDFSQAGDKLAVALADGRVVVADAGQAEPGNFEVLMTLSNHADWVTSVAWSDDATRLVSASRDKSVKVQDAASGELLTNYQAHAAAAWGAVFTADGAQVLSSGGDGKLHRWNVVDGAKVAEVPLGGDGFQPIRADGFVLVPVADGRLLKIDLASNAVSVAMAGHQDWVLSGAIRLGETPLAVSGSIDGTVRTWDFGTGTMLGQWLAKP